MRSFDEMKMVNVVYWSAYTNKGRLYTERHFVTNGGRFYSAPFQNL